MKPALTPWFPAHVKPKHIGVYQRGYIGQIHTRFWYWNGKYWEVGGWEHADDAAKNPRGKTSQTYLAWRGLAEDPAKAAP